MDNNHGKSIFKNENLKKHQNLLALYSHTFPQAYRDIEKATSSVIVPLQSVIKKFTRLRGDITLKLVFDIVVTSSTFTRTKKSFPSQVVRCEKHRKISQVILECSTFVIDLCSYALNARGYSITSVTKVNASIGVHEYETIYGYLPPPPQLKHKRGILSVKESNKRNFLFALVTGLYFCRVKTSRKSDKKENLINFKRMQKHKVWTSLMKGHSFKLTDLNFCDDDLMYDLFEFINGCSISIFRFSKTANKVVPYRMTKRMVADHVSLLLCYKKDLSKQERKKFPATVRFLCIYDMSELLGLKQKLFVGLCRLCGCCFKEKTHELVCYKNNSCMPYQDDQSEFLSDEINNAESSEKEQKNTNDKEVAVKNITHPFKIDQVLSQPSAVWITYFTKQLLRSLSRNVYANIQAYLQEHDIPFVSVALVDKVVPFKVRKVIKKRQVYILRYQFSNSETVVFNTECPFYSGRRIMFYLPSTNK